MRQKAFWIIWIFDIDCLTKGRLKATSVQTAFLFNT